MLCQFHLNLSCRSHLLQSIEGFCKAKKLKEMYETNFKFPEGWWGLRDNPFHGGSMDIFWNYTVFAFNEVYLLYLLKVLIGLWNSLSPL